MTRQTTLEVALASLALQNVSVSFPMYHGASFSLKKTALGHVSRLLRRSPASPRRSVLALNNVTLAFEHGDRVGLIGPNGAGKSTLLRVLAGVYEPTSGRIEVQGRVSSLFDVTLGIDHDSTGFENIYLRALYLGLRPREIKDRIDAIAEFTELGEFLNMPLRTYSTGMAYRLAFAVTTFLRPEILLMDEWVLAGDAAFQEKASVRLRELVETSGILVLASHAADILRQWCDKGVFIAGGEVRAVGPIDEVLDAYRHAQHGG
jgi:ABC-2 type transport system ATP-binding protein/lipopolysaccharide transport system ATP-binding protein